MQAGGLGLFGREVGIELPGVRAGLEAGRIFQVEARLILEIMGEKFGFDPGAVLFADGLGEVEIAQVARRCVPIGFFFFFFLLL